MPLVSKKIVKEDLISLTISPSQKENVAKTYCRPNLVLKHCTLELEIKSISIQAATTLGERYRANPSW